MCYFHIEDLLTEKVKMMTKEEFEEYFKEPGTFRNRCIRYLKSNIGSGNAMNCLEVIMKDFRFISIEVYGIKYQIVNTVKI